jgi:hypothetical protein
VRIPSSRWWIAALFLGAPALASAQDSAAGVSGQVTDSATGAPILRAHVMLAQWTRNGHSYGALTGDKGNFTIEQLPAGHYSFRVEAAGFEPSYAVPDDRIGNLELGAGEHRRDVNIALTPWGAISGRVIDAEGRPVQGVPVSALGLEGFVSYQISDPRGEYRMPHLSPGRYRVRAAPEAVHMPPEIRSDGTTELRYASTYYPGSLTPQSAEPLDILPGVERSGIDIRLVRAPIVAVRGTVSGMEAAVDVGLDIQKLEPPRGPSTGRGEMRYGDPVNSDGSFAVWGLDPGTYVFVGQSNDGGWQSAPVEVTVEGKNVNGVHIAMKRQLTISGQVIAGGEDGLAAVPPDAPLGQQKQISLREVSSGAMRFSVVANDGTFQLHDVPPGRYFVQLTRGLCVQSMRLGSTDIDGSILDLRDGPDGALTVSASSATGEIAGVVRNAAGPVAHAHVALVAEENPGWLPVASASADGGYSFPKLRPGRYQLLVLDGRAAYASALRFVLFDYADIVETIDLGAGEHATRDVRQHDPK